MEIKGFKFDKYKGKIELIGKIASGSTRTVLEDSKTYGAAIAVGLMQGLKYNGSFIRGAKAGVVTLGVVIGANIVQNVVINLDEIKKA